MRIAFVAQPFDRMYPPVRESSLALWTYYMARLSARRGHEVFVFGNHGDYLTEHRSEEDGVRYIFTRTGLDRLVNKALRTRDGFFPAQRSPARPAFAGDWHHRGFAWQVARRVRQLNCDVVHVINYSQFVPVLRRALPGCTISLHMQCEWLTQVDRSLIEPRLKHADIIVGCSEYIRELIANAFPEYSGRCVAVPNAAEPPVEDSRPTPSMKHVLFVGRLSPEKGVHDLIRAFRLVLRCHPDAELHLVGGAGSAPIEFLIGLSRYPHVTALRVFYEHSAPGDDKDGYLRCLEKEAGDELGKRIRFIGSIPHDQIETYYRSAAVLVNPSLSESFGISLVEAMMRRIPVVATRIGGMTHTVDDGVTGLLVDAANPEKLAEAICRVLSDPCRARQMGEAGRDRAMGMFSWERTADLLLGHFEQLSRRRQSECQ